MEHRETNRKVMTLYNYSPGPPELPSSGKITRTATRSCVTRKGALHVYLLVVAVARHVRALWCGVPPLICRCYCSAAAAAADAAVTRQFAI